MQQFAQSSGPKPSAQNSLSNAHWARLTKGPKTEVRLRNVYSNSIKNKLILIIKPVKRF